MCLLMRFKGKVISSLLIAFGALIASILYPVVPCQKIPNVPNPSSSFTMCSLNPDLAHAFNSSILYFGYTEHMTTAYFVVLVTAFFAAFAIFHFMGLKHK